MVENISTLNLVLTSIILGASIVITGIIFSNAFVNARTGNRFANVRGLAERDVDADVAVWPITFIETGNDLGLLQKEIDPRREFISGFLKNVGFESAELS